MLFRSQGEGAQVKFFGAWTRVPGGAAHFSLKTGAPVVVAGLWRTPQNTYAGVALPPLRFQSTGDRDRDVDAAMQRIMGHIEMVIRTHPDQWYMFRRMWPERTSAQPEAGLSALPAGA